MAEMRLAAGFTVVEAAEAIGATQSFFAQVEKGRHRFRLDWVPILADLYDESVEDVVQAALNTYYHGFYDPPLPSKRRRP